MLLKGYEDQGLLCNLSVKGATGEAGVWAYRGDLVITEGDIADASGRRKPPKEVLKQAILLIRDDKLQLVSGALHDIALLEPLLARYAGDLRADAKLVIYVENIGRNLDVEINGVKCLLLPHSDGAVWNTLMDDVHLEKEDFKGQSSEDKVVTLYKGVLDFKLKATSLSYTDALGEITEVRKAARGAV